MKKCKDCGKQLTSFCQFCKMSKLSKTVKNHIRGDSAYYSKIGKKGSKKRWKNYKKSNQKI